MTGLKFQKKVQPYAAHTGFKENERQDSTALEAVKMKPRYYITWCKIIF